MLPTQEFLKARKDKKLSAFLVINRPEESQIMRLCIDVKLPYSTKTEMVFIECPTDVFVDNYSNDKKVTQVCFHTFFSRLANSNYVETFLNAIKKDSDISFRVVAFNSSEWSERNNVVCHKLIGRINNSSYLLAEYVGSDNSASPIKWTAKNTVPVS
jgi:hypothetical protein